MVGTQGLISEDTFIECLHFAGPFFGYQEYESELGRQVGEQVILGQFEVCTDGGQWVRFCPLWLGEGGGRKMELELSQS